jgi:hypothetical protein
MIEETAIETEIIATGIKNLNKKSGADFFPDLSKLHTNFFSIP